MTTDTIRALIQQLDNDAAALFSEAEIAIHHGNWTAYDQILASLDELHEFLHQVKRHLVAKAQPGAVH